MTPVHGSGHGHGNDHTNQISADVSVIHVGGDITVPGTGGNAAVKYTLPACWYTAALTGAQLYAVWLTLTVAFPYAYAWIQAVYPGNKPADYHVGEDGMWYAPTCRADADPTAVSDWATRHPAYYIWVPARDPQPPDSVDWPDLVRVAQKYTDLTLVKLQTSPNLATTPATVFLPTWVWVDPAEWNTPAVVTASVPTMTVTTTARRKYLLIEPGTSSGRVKVYGDTKYDGKVACTLGGAPYAGDATAKPPCGVEYLHSTADSGNYDLKISVVWEVTWTKKGQYQGLVADDPYITTDDVTQSVRVREVQTEVSGSY